MVALQVNKGAALPGVRQVCYPIQGRSSPHIHRWLVDLEAKTLRAEAAWNAACALRDEGFQPDAIVAHPGWGESLFLKQVWPHSRLGLYCEFFYQVQGADTAFDPEFNAPDVADGCRLQMKNANYELHLLRAEAGLAPTAWQAASFPDWFAPKIRVIHDGIDTEVVRPEPKATVRIQTSDGPVNLSREDEVITFVNRNLEPYRGYHIFMRALPAILAARPRARVVIIGGDDVSYGAAPPADAQGRTQTWKQIFLKEVAGQIDLRRVHFVGRVPYPAFLRVLQVSSVHVYLTYPFVLSWSLLEAMSAGCAIVASDTAPVREAITDGETGCLVDFFDVPGLAARVAALCEDRSEMQRLGANARTHAQATYDLQRLCLPRQMEWVQSLG